MPVERPKLTVGALRELARDQGGLLTRDEWAFILGHEFDRLTKFAAQEYQRGLREGLVQGVKPKEGT